MNVKIRYKCPYCARSIEHNPHFAGELVSCAACHGEFYEPTDPLPGRTAEKPPPPRGGTAPGKAAISRSPVGFDPAAESAPPEKKPVEKPAEKSIEKAPAAASGPKLKEPRSAKPQEDDSPLGGSLWAQVSETPKSKPPVKAPAVPMKSGTSGTPSAVPSKSAVPPGKPAPAARPASTTPPSSSDDNEDEIDFQAFIQDAQKPKTPGVNSAAAPPKAGGAPMARPAAPGQVSATAPMARPAAPPATMPRMGHAAGGNSLQTATPTEMANELRRRGMFAAIVFGDPSKPDQCQLAFSDNMTRDDAKTFLGKLLGAAKHPAGEGGEAKPGGLFGRLFGGGNKEG